MDFYAGGRRQYFRFTKHIRVLVAGTSATVSLAILSMILRALTSFAPLVTDRSMLLTLPRRFALHLPNLHTIDRIFSVSISHGSPSSHWLTSLMLPMPWQSRKKPTHDTPSSCPAQSIPFSFFHFSRYLSPLKPPFGSPSKSPFSDCMFFVTNGVNCSL